MPVSRARFKLWLALETIKEKIAKAVDTDALSDAIEEYLATALAFPVSDLSTCPWEEAITAFARVTEINGDIRMLPFMRYPVKDQKPAAYDYDERLFFHYAHTFARAYGWSIEYVADLDVDTAFSLLQEIIITTQLDREWQWDLSERSTGYDEQTRKSKHIPYPLPPWMSPAPTEPKIYRIPKALIPVGNVVRYRNDQSS